MLHEVHFLLTKGDTPVVGGESSVVAMETDSVCTTDELQVVKNSAQKKLDDKMAEEERDMKINWIVKFVLFNIYNCFDVLVNYMFFRQRIYMFLLCVIDV